MAATIKNITLEELFLHIQGTGIQNALTVRKEKRKAILVTGRGGL
jgi:hypothetical protein